MLGDAPVMDPHADLLACHGVQKLIAAYPRPCPVDQERVQVVGMPGAGLHGSGRPDGKPRERFLIFPPDSLPLLPVLLDSRKLVDADRRLEIHHVVLESRFHDVIVLEAGIAEPFPRIFAHPVKPEHLDAVRVLRSPGDHEPPLPGHDVLGRIEAEAAEIAHRSGLLSLVLGLDGVRTVLDDGQIVFTRDRHDGVHGACTSCEMDREDGPRPPRDFFQDFRRVNVHCPRLDVCEHGSAPRVYDRVHRRTERHRTGDHLVPRPDVPSRQADVQCRRAGVERGSVCGPLVRRKVTLEPRHLRSSPQPCLCHGIKDLFLLLLFDQRLPENEKFVPHGCSLSVMVSALPEIPDTAAIELFILREDHLAGEIPLDMGPSLGPQTAGQWCIMEQTQN